MRKILELFFLPNNVIIVVLREFKEHVDCGPEKSWSNFEVIG